MACTTRHRRPTLPPPESPMSNQRRPANGQPHLALPDAIAREKAILGRIQAMRAQALLNTAVPLAVAMLRQGVSPDVATDAAIKAAVKIVDATVKEAQNYNPSDPAATPEASAIIQP